MIIYPALDIQNTSASLTGGRREYGVPDPYEAAEHWVGEGH